MVNPLTTAIVNHDIKGMVGTLRERPELAFERHLDRLPIEWAAATGDVGLYLRANRLLGPAATGVDHRGLLRDYILALSRTNYFGAVSTALTAMRVWEQLREGIVRPFSKDEPEFRLDDERKLDLELLLCQAGLTTQSDLVSLADEKREAGTVRHDDR
jgi:hypothetical protein